MKLRHLLILLAALALPTHAHAGVFDFLVTAVVAYVLGPFGTGVISWFGVSAVVVLSAYNENKAYDLQRQQEEQAKAARDAYNSSLQDRTITSVTTAAPFVTIYGRARVGSAVVAIFASGNKDQYRHIIAVHAAHECDAIEEIYIAKKALGPLNFDGYCTSSPDYCKTVTISPTTITGVSIPIDPRYIVGTVRIFRIVQVEDNASTALEELVDFEIVDNAVAVENGSYLVKYSYADATVRVIKHLGVPGEGADAVLMAECPDKWNEFSKLSGFCYTYIRIDLNQQEFQGGLPGIEALIRGKRVFDPRDESTAWSQNPALAIYDFLRSEFCGVPESDIPADYVSAAADVCDEEIAIGPRYTFNGTVTSAQDKPGLLTQMAQSMGGGINPTTWEMWAGQWVEPDLDLDQSDIVGVLALTPGLSDADIYNGVTARFITSENDYAVTDMTPYVNSAYLAADGRELMLGMEFPFTDETQRCHNLARMYIEDLRNSFTIKATFKLKAWGAKVGQRITFTSEYLGLDAKAFRVVSKIINPSGFVELSLKEDAPEIWDEADAVVIDATPNTGLPNPFEISTPESLSLSSGTPTLLTQLDGTVISRIMATWPVSRSVYASQAELQLRSPGNTDWQTLAVVDASQGFAYLGPVLDGVTYEVRARFVNPNLAVTSDWRVSDFHTVVGKTAPPGTPSGLAVVGQQVYWATVPDADLAGYFVRAAAGRAGLWGSAAPLHEGFVTSVPFTIPTRLFGVYTVLVAAVDTSGNLSEVVSTVCDFGRVAINNVVQRLDFQAASFPGTYSNCSVSGGELMADADSTGSVYALDDVYSQSGLYGTTYLQMQWETSVFTPRYNGTLTLLTEIQGAAVIEYRVDGSTSNDLYSKVDVYSEADLYVGASDWQVWPGSIDVGRGTGIQWRISVDGGATRGAVVVADAYFSKDSVRQTFGAQAISAAGTRLAPSQGSPNYDQWLQIHTVQVTPIVDGGGAAYARILDMLPQQGPLIQLVNQAGTPVSGTATIDIGGLVDV